MTGVQTCALPIFPESELVLNQDGSVYHLHLKGEHIADNVILVGDPGRVAQVADFFDSMEFQTSNREFVTVTDRKSVV